MTHGRTVVSGMTWLFTSNILTRIITLLGQIVLGWLLAADDFGVYAIATSMVTVVAALRNGGIAEIIVRNGTHYQTQAGLFFKYSLAFNLTAMLILSMLALAYLHGNPAVSAVLTATAVSILMTTPATILKAKLTIDRRFSELAKIGLGVAIVWQGGIVLCALSGLGAWSYVFPLLFYPLYEYLATWRYERKLPQIHGLNTWQEYLRLFQQTRWLMLSTAMLALATTGVFFAVAHLTDERTVGIYFFAYQLVVSLAMPLQSTVETALPASLVQFDSDRKRQVETYLRALRAILVTGIPLVGILALALPLLTDVVWHGRWNAAGEIAQILVMCIPAWLIIAVARALIEARGMWRLRFFMLGAYGIGAMAATVMGTLSGGLQAIAFSVVVFYNCFALLLLIGVSTLLQVPFGRAAICVLAPAALGLAAFFLSAEGSQLINDIKPSALSMLLAFVGLSGLGNSLLFRDVWMQLLASTIGRLRQFWPAAKI